MSKMKNMESDSSRLSLEKNEEWIILGNCGLNLLNIARMEIQTAFARVPGLLLLYLLKLPALILMWISFSLLPAWVAFQVSETIFAGLFVFFLLQAVLVILIDRMTRHKLKESSLPVSREYAARIASLILTDPESEEDAGFKNSDKRNEV